MSRPKGLSSLSVTTNPDSTSTARMRRKYEICGPIHATRVCRAVILAGVQGEPAHQTRGYVQLPYLKASRVRKEHSRAVCCHSQPSRVIQLDGFSRPDGALACGSANQCPNVPRGQVRYPDRGVF
eukprot:1360338-Rhodomonas_salina.1